MTPAEQFAALLGAILVIWNTIVLVSSMKHVRRPSQQEILRAFMIHLLPPTFLFGASKLANNSSDPALVWFLALVFSRYYKTIIGIFNWYRYKPAIAALQPKFNLGDCTVIIPTVGPKGNEAFEDMLCSILANKPARIIIATNNEKAESEVNEATKTIRSKFEDCKTAYQHANGLKGFQIPSDIFKVINSNVSNKREQFLTAAKATETKLIAMVDDTAVWTPNLLNATLPAFEEDDVGLVGVKKWVKRLPYNADPNKSALSNWLAAWYAGYMNTLGALYLIRHNFEIRSAYAADGGVFCISGRTAMIRTSIVQDKAYDWAFKNEYVIDFWGIKIGHLAADDDVFTTRWILNTGWKPRIQYSDDATMTTTIGNKGKFQQQCLRWSRTTLRQNLKSLFVDRVIWWRWPITVWTTHFAWLWNASLLWDPAMVYMMTQTAAYKSSTRQGLMLTAMVGFIYATKLIKIFPWFLANPDYFFLYFFPIPATPLFSYYHSILKLWTWVTILDTSWAGRKLPADQTRGK